MTYLITGACGSLDRCVTSAFLSAGHDIIGIDIKTPVSQKKHQIHNSERRLLIIFWQISMIWGKGIDQ